jgi:hypothetical protein
VTFKTHFKRDLKMATMERKVLTKQEQLDNVKSSVTKLEENKEHASRMAYNLSCYPYLRNLVDIDKMLQDLKTKGVSYPETFQTRLFDLVGAPWREVLEPSYDLVEEVEELWLPTLTPEENKVREKNMEEIMLEMFTLSCGIMCEMGKDDPDVYMKVVFMLTGEMSNAKIPKSHKYAKRYRRIMSRGFNYQSLAEAIGLLKLLDPDVADMMK